MQQQDNVLKFVLIFVRKPRAAPTGLMISAYAVPPLLQWAAAFRPWRNYLSMPGNSRASTSLVEAWISVPDDCTSPPTRRNRLPMTPAASPCLLTGIEGMIDHELVAGSYASTERKVAIMCGS